MGKRIELEDGFCHERRRRRIKVTEEWVGETLHPQTKRKRPPKNRAAKQELRNPFEGCGVDWRGSHAGRHRDFDF